MKEFRFFLLLIFQLFVFSQGLSESAFAQTSSGQAYENQNTGWDAPRTGTLVARSDWTTVNTETPPSFPEATGFDPSVVHADFQAAVHPASAEPLPNSLAEFGDSLLSNSAGWFDSLASEGSWGEKAMSLFQGSDVARMLGSLSLVLGLYFSFVWVLRKLNLTQPRVIPQEVVEVIGNKPLGPRQSLQLVRLGSKLLLLMNTAEGTQPIGEITEPSEVEYLASLCPGARTAGAASSASIKQAASRLERAIQQSNQPTRLSDVLRLLENSTGTNLEA